MMYRNITYIPENKSGQVFSHGKDRQPSFQRRIRLVQSITAGQEIDSVLIVGCGMGHEMKAWQPHAHRVEGIDLSELAIERAKEQGLAADLCSLENAEEMGQYDVVVCGDLLEHVYDLHSSLESLRKLVKPEEGILIIDVPESDNPYVDVSEFYNPEHLWHFTSYTLRRIMAQYGFVEERNMFDRNNIVGAYVLHTENLKKAFDAYERGREQEHIACEEWLNKLPQPYAVWGASEYFRFMRQAMPDAFKPTWIVDSAPGVALKPEEVFKEDAEPPAVVICSRMFKDEIKQQLKDMGYKGEVFVPAEKPWLKK
jgi:2-polyprenyl-3-methyl-5-hydroxy-6-metoxy-1,4-benzoquinol methylase